MNKGALKVFNKQKGVWEQIPTLKGKDFTYDDFTPEQIAGLQRPALDAANNANTAADSAAATAQTRIDALITAVNNQLNTSTLWETI